MLVKAAVMVRVLRDMGLLLGWPYRGERRLV